MKIKSLHRGFEFEGQFPFHGLKGNQKKFHLPVELGKVTALVGDNGIGKSTLFHFLKYKLNVEKMLGPNYFFQFIDQKPLSALGDRTFEDYMKVVQDLCPERFVLSDFIKENDEWKKLCQKPIRHLSGGENQWAKMMAHFSTLADGYFLDEPLTFLDQRKRELVKCLINKTLSSTLKPCFMVIIDHDKNFLQSFNPTFIELSEDHVE
jgi:translation initiation factor RLI1